MVLQNYNYKKKIKETFSNNIKINQVYRLIIHIQGNYN